MKLHIIGGSGSGKSHCAALLGEKLGIAHYDLDDIHWDPRSDEYGVRTPEAERDRMLLDIIGQDTWIVEGVYRSWVEPSFDAADRIIVLMTPLSIQEARIWKRYEERISGAAPSKKRETFEGTRSLLAWNRDYNETKLPHLLKHWAYTDKTIVVRDNLDVLGLFERR